MNPTNDEKRSAFPFRTAIRMGAAAVAPRPPSRGLSVLVLPFYCGQISPERASYKAVGSVHSGLPTITGSTDDVSEERMRSSDLYGVQARGTPPRPRSSLAAYYLGGRNGTRTHKGQIMNHERRVQEKRETLLTRISNGEQAL